MSNLIISLICISVLLLFANVNAAFWSFGSETTTNETSSTSPSSNETSTTISHSISPIIEKGSYFETTTIIPISDKSIETKFDITTGKSLPVVSVAEQYSTESSILDEKGCDRNLFPRLANFFNSSLLSDFEFLLGKNIIKVHQFVLSAKSSVFRKFFTDSDYSGEPHEIQRDHDDSFIEFLRFFYTENFPIDQDSDLKHIKNVYLLAKEYKVPRLMQFIGENLNKSFSLEKLSEIFEFAFYEKLNKSVDDWRRYVRDNSDQIYKDKLYSCNNSYIMECIIFSMQMNESQKLTAFKQILRQKRSDVDITRYKELFNIPDCDAQELSELRDMKLFDQKEFLDRVITKFNNLCEKDRNLKSLQNKYDQIKADYDKLKQDNEDLRRKFIPYSYLPHERININPNTINSQNGRRINVGHFNFNERV